MDSDDDDDDDDIVFYIPVCRSIKMELVTWKFSDFFKVGRHKMSNTQSRMKQWINYLSSNSLKPSRFYWANWLGVLSFQEVRFVSSALKLCSIETVHLLWQHCTDMTVSSFSLALLWSVWDGITHTHTPTVWHGVTHSASNTLQRPLSSPHTV